MKKSAMMAAGFCLLWMFSFVRGEEAKPAVPAKAEAKASEPAKRAAVKKKASKKAKAEPKKGTKVVYKCGHCNTTSDKPGKCPMCGMEMKKT